VNGKKRERSLLATPTGKEKGGKGPSRGGFLKQPALLLYPRLHPGKGKGGKRKGRNAKKGGRRVYHFSIFFVDRRRGRRSL